jgi:hypothetical protein
MKLKGRPSNYSLEQIQEVLDLWNTGEYGYKLIAKKTGMGINAVKYYVRREKKNAANSSNDT